MAEMSNQLSTEISLPKFPIQVLSHAQVGKTATIRGTTVRETSVSRHLGAQIEDPPTLKTP